MEKFLLNIVANINTYLSNYILIILLIGVGLFYSIKTRFVQVRCFGEGWKRMFANFSLNGKKQKSGLSSFQSLATAIAAQVGTGNIVGACGAILIGGPGAIFWMWVIAFFGMATIYGEAVVAQKTRIVDEDGTEYELEVLTTVEFNGATYLAVIPADDGSDEEADLEVSILKSVEEDGESILCAIEDEQELQAVYDLIMDQLYEEEEE